MGFKTTKTVSDINTGGGSFYPVAFHRYMGKITSFEEAVVAGKDVLKFGVTVLKDKDSKDTTYEDEFIIWPNDYQEDNVLRMVKAVLTSPQNDNLVSDSARTNLEGNDIDLNNLVGCYVTAEYRPQQKKVDGVYKDTIYSRLTFINSTYKFSDTICTDAKKFEEFDAFRKSQREDKKSGGGQAAAPIAEDTLPF
jgi:hypothetical protein